MYRKLSIPVGVAMLAALALVGMLGIFAFNAAQPAQADGIGSATVSVGDSMTGATTDYTFSVMTNGALVENTFINLDPPMGYTVMEGTMQGTVDGISATVSARAGGAYNVALPNAVNSGATVMIVIPGLMNPATAGTYTWMVDSGLGSAAPVSAMVTIEDGGNGGNGGTTTPGMVDVSDASVTARPDDPGDKTQITVKFKTNEFLDINDSITIEIGDDFGVPDNIDEEDVDISGLTAVLASDSPGSRKVANPQSIIVDFNDPDERFTIELFIGNMDDSADQPLDLGLAKGDVTVTFHQAAGLTNRTEGGEDDWFVYTSEEDTPVQIDEDNVYNVPWTIKLSSYGDPRGEEITVIGKGFKNGTTTTFWIDKNQDGMIGTGEDELCDAIASGADIAECTFTLGNPPFDPGKAKNYINAVDGRDKKVLTRPLNRIELEPSLSVSPKQGNPGDSINYQLRDFHPGSSVTRIQFARSIDICGGSSNKSCPSGTVGDNGNLSFSFDIPNNIGAGSQDLKVWTEGTNEADGIVKGDDNITFVVGAGELQLSSTNVLPNQRISVSASGFTKSSNRAPAYIGERNRPADNACGTKTGSVILGGEEVPWGRINDNEAIEVTSGGTWSATIDLPINSATVVSGTRTLKITDCQGGEASIDLIFAEREVTMTPEEGGVGTEVVITGKNFPVSNDDGTDIEVMVEYDPTIGKSDDDDVEPDAVGSFTVILEVPEDAGIPSDNTVKVLFREDDGSEVLDTFTHRVPQGTVSFSATGGAEGSTLTITAKGFARFTSVDTIEFDDREITPAPKPSTDTNGNGSFDIRIPGADPGIYIIRVEIEEVVATSTFTVVSGSGVSDGAVETVLGNVISEDALDRVFRFDNATKMWAWYISDPAFASTNNLGGLSSGDLVYIKVTKDVTANILGASTTLTCTNAGTDTEDCWNLVAIP